MPTYKCGHSTNAETTQPSKWHNLEDARNRLIGMGNVQELKHAPCTHARGLPLVHVMSQVTGTEPYKAGLQYGPQMIARMLCLTCLCSMWHVEL